jgi:hypothetical protein
MRETRSERARPCVDDEVQAGIVVCRILVNQIGVFSKVLHEEVRLPYPVRIPPRKPRNQVVVGRDIVRIGSGRRQRPVEIAGEVLGDVVVVPSNRGLSQILPQRDFILDPQIILPV